MRTVFYAWQSDLPNSTNRHFIEQCLDLVIVEINKELSSDHRLFLDKDTQGEAGMVAVSDTILGKIKACTVFVPDLSIVTAAESGRQMPNGNVLFELGYAMNAISERRIVAVFNESFGSRKELPFDIQHRRWPISYSLNDGAPAGERKKTQNDLVSSLTKAIRASAEHAGLGTHGPANSQSPPNLSAVTFGSYDLPSRFQNGRVIATVDASTPGVGADGRVIYRHAPHGFIDLRPAEAKNTDSWTTLRSRAVRKDFHLTAFGPRGTQWFSRNEEGIIAGDIVSNPQQVNVLCFTQLYKSSGALYGVNQAIAMNDGNRSFIPADKMRSDFIRSLANYLNFYRCNSDLQPPLRLYAGFEVLRDMYLAVGTPQGLQFVGPCVENPLWHSIDHVLLDSDPRELLRPLFAKLWDSVEVAYED